MENEAQARLEIEDLQQNLREVQELLLRQRLVEDLVHRQEMPKHELVEKLVHKQHLTELRGKYADSALLQVAENVRSNEPNTISFFVSQDQANACVFTTYERFADQAAMDAHNNSEVVARFFGIAKPILDGDVVLVTGTEVAAKA